MKIEDIDLKDKHVGSKVTYIPYHAYRNAHHSDCEGGTISSWNDSFIYVNYGTGTSAATKSKNLVWG